MQEGFESFVGWRDVAVRHGMTLAERLAAPLRASPEMCSLNMGSMNFGLYPMLDRYPEFKYEWLSEAGTFSDMTADSTGWTAPDDAGHQ